MKHLAAIQSEFLHLAKKFTVMGEKQDVNDDPSDAQIENGNYKKATISIPGLPKILVENPSGSVRSGVSPEGVPWETKMKHHYGYFEKSKGKDKDQIDVFVKEGDPEKVAEQPAFIVNQIDPETKKFDEHKVILGCDTEEQAKKMYLANYEKGWKGLESIVEMALDKFQKWVSKPQTKPA